MLLSSPPHGRTPRRAFGTLGTSSHTRRPWGLWAPAHRSLIGDDPRGAHARYDPGRRATLPAVGPNHDHTRAPSGAAARDASPANARVARDSSARGPQEGCGDIRGGHGDPGAVVAGTHIPPARGKRVTLPLYRTRFAGHQQGDVRVCPPRRSSILTPLRDRVSRVTMVMPPAPRPERPPASDDRAVRDEPFGVVAGEELADDPLRLSSVSTRSITPLHSGSPTYEGVIVIRATSPR